MKKPIKLKSKIVIKRHFIVITLCVHLFCVFFFLFTVLICWRPNSFCCRFVASRVMSPNSSVRVCVCHLCNIHADHVIICIYNCVYLGYLFYILNLFLHCFSLSPSLTVFVSPDLFAFISSILCFSSFAFGSHMNSNHLFAFNARHKRNRATETKIFYV